MGLEALDLVREKPDNLPVLIRRCIVSVLDRDAGKVVTPSEYGRATSICLAMLSKSKRIQKNTTTLTGLGRRKNLEARRKPDTSRKMNRYAVIVEDVLEALGAPPLE